MTLRPVFPQHLDTVWFSNDRFDPHEIAEHESRASLVAKLSVMVFGVLRLSLHQLLDVRPFRSGVLEELLLAPEALEFFWYNREVVATPRDALALLLNRGGDDAFIFSSIADGTRLAAEWGARRARLGEKASADDLIAEARKIPEYAPVLDFAERCSAIRPQIVGDGAEADTFETTCRNLALDIREFDELPQGFPKSRSMAQNWLRSSRVERHELVRRMLPYDAVYNLRLSMLGRAVPLMDRLERVPGTILEPEFILLTELGVTDADGRPLVVVDFDLGQLDRTANRPFVRALNAAPFPDVVRVSRDPVIAQLRQEAWVRADSGELQRAASAFGELLRAADSMLRGRASDEPEDKPIVIGPNKEVDVDNLRDRLARWLRKPLHGVVRVHRPTQGGG
jgi:hypothetical protein